MNVCYTIVTGDFQYDDSFTFTPFICYAILSQEKAARSARQEIKKNSAIIKQRNGKEKSILKELGTLQFQYLSHPKKTKSSLQKVQ